MKMESYLQEALTTQDFNVFFTFLNPNPSGSETPKDERKGWHS